MKQGTRLRVLGAIGVCAVLAAPLMIGTVSFAKSTGMGHGHKVMAKVAASAVASVTVNKTAQMVEAAPAAASRKEEATFVLTAKLANGRPAAGEQVTYYIGPMKPLSNVAPKFWVQSGTKVAAHYIAMASAKTNARGQATIVLLGQPADSMEMVGVKVGTLSGFDVAAHRATASLDAWWTSAKSRPTAPVGDYVTVSPFLATAHAMSKQRLSVGVYNAKGQPIDGAHVAVSVKAAASSGMSGSVSAGMGMSTGMSGGMGMSASAGLQLTTNVRGQVMTEIAWPAHATAVPVRIVVTQPSGGMRIAGGMNSEFFAN